MVHINIFPYKNRMLGMQESKVSPELNMNTQEQTLIAIANFKNGQKIPLKGGYESVVVDFISDGAITYTPTPGDGSKVTLNVSDIRESELFHSVSSTIDSVHPEYDHPICEIIESDPAIYRLRTQEGYVINDALCLMSGNVNYTKKVDVDVEEVAPTDEIINEIDSKTEKEEPLKVEQFSLF